MKQKGNISGPDILVDDEARRRKDEVAVNDALMNRLHGRILEANSHHRQHYHIPSEDLSVIYGSLKNALAREGVYHRDLCMRLFTEDDDSCGDTG